MSQPPTLPIKYLGYQNSWKQVPPEVKACRDEVAAGVHHRISSRQLLKYSVEYTCQTCGYRYMVADRD
jgi:hypothetical protein